MAAVPNEKVEVRVQGFRFAAKYNFVFFPIEQAGLLTLLLAHGYQSTVQQAPSRPPGVTIQLMTMGEIAKKENLTFDMDQNRQILGINGIPVGLAVDDFSSIEQSLNEQLGVKLDQNVIFYEALANFVVHTGKNPLKTIGRAATPNPWVASLSKVLGKDVSPFSIRVGLMDAQPNSTEWLDVTVEPVITKPSADYQVLILYRHPTKEPVADFARTIEEKVRAIVESIESQSPST